MRGSGPPRVSGRGYRGGRGGGVGYRRYYANTDQDIHPSLNGEYPPDYPADFSTLYPVNPEFIMPYVSQTYYPVTYAPPPNAVLEDGQLKSAYVPVEESIVIDMVKKQV